MSANTAGVKIWGRKNSINVMKTVWCAEELGLPFQRMDVGGAFGGTQTPEYLAMNPNARVPTLTDGGLVLWESNVIVRYLSFTYGNPGLFPADVQSRWMAEQWMDWQQTTVGPAMFGMFWGLVRTEPDKRDHAAIETSRKTTEDVFRILNDHLAHRSYVAGDSFTMADIPLGAAVYRWYALDIERPAFAHLKAWYDRLTQRESYRTHVMLPLT